MGDPLDLVRVPEVDEPSIELIEEVCGCLGMEYSRPLLALISNVKMETLPHHCAGQCRIVRVVWMMAVEKEIELMKARITALEETQGEQ